MSEICEVKNCKEPVGITYAAGKKGSRRGVCNTHWGRHSEQENTRPLKNNNVFKKN